MKHTYQTIRIGNKEHKIITGTYPEQCDEYYKALENKDAYVAHRLHLPYVQRDPKMIQFEVDMLTEVKYKEQEGDINN